MAQSSSPGSRKRPAQAGAGRPTQKRTPPTASRRRRRSRRSLLPRLIVGAVTLAVLVGIIALVRATITGSATSGQATTAPDFTVSTLSGTTFQLAAEFGHPVVLYFMATTCASCVQGSHNVAEALQSARTTGAEVLAIDVNATDRPADLEAFIQSAGIPASAPIQWSIDTTGAITTAYGVQTLETTVVIDRHGQVAYRQDGSIPPAQLAQLLKNLA
jgi:peroxiredoxin